MCAYKLLWCRYFFFQQKNTNNKKKSEMSRISGFLRAATTSLRSEVSPLEKHDVLSRPKWGKKNIEEKKGRWCEEKSLTHDRVK